MCIDNLDKIKKSIKKDDEALKLKRLISLFYKYGQSENDFDIIDEVIIDLALTPAQSARRVASVNYQVMYQYKLRDNVVGGLVIKTTRDFCRGVIGAARLYTMGDINMMSQREGRDIFTLTGGSYTNPETGIHTYYCRHVWFQVLARKK
jgi:hypothetical protein